MFIVPIILVANKEIEESNLRVDSNFALIRVENLLSILSCFENKRDVYIISRIFGIHTISLPDRLHYTARIDIEQLCI